MIPGLSETASKNVKKILAAAALLGTISLIEFVFLVAAEIRDDNPWSAGVRIVGLLVTLTLGAVIWRRIRSIQKDLVPPVLDMRVSSALNTDDLPPPSPPCECGYPFPSKGTGGRCHECWAVLVSERLGIS